MNKLLSNVVVSLFAISVTTAAVDSFAAKGGKSGGGNSVGKGANQNSKSSDQITSKSNADKFDSNVRAKGLQSLKFLDAGKTTGKSFDSRLSATIQFISRFDANGDGQVTKDEAVNLATRKFTELNVDSTGNITRNDLIAVLSENLALETSVIFNAMDKNKDGKLAAGESFNTHNSLVGNGADIDGDGRISLQEYNNYNLSLIIDATIEELDANKDGEVSSEELVADTESQLTDSDTNQDGLITESDAI